MSPLALGRQGVHVSTNEKGVLVIAFLIALWKENAQGYGWENKHAYIERALATDHVVKDSGSKTEPAAKIGGAGQWTVGLLKEGLWMPGATDKLLLGQMGGGGGGEHRYSTGLRIDASIGT